MCDPIQVTLLKMQPHSSQSSRENATPSSSTSPLASYEEVPPSPGPPLHKWRSSVEFIHDFVADNSVAYISVL